MLKAVMPSRLKALSKPRPQTGHSNSSLNPKPLIRDPALSLGSPATRYCLRERVVKQRHLPLPADGSVRSRKDLHSALRHLRRLRRDTLVEKHEVAQLLVRLVDGIRVSAPSPQVEEHPMLAMLADDGETLVCLRAASPELELGPPLTPQQIAEVHAVGHWKTVTLQRLKPRAVADFLAIHPIREIRHTVANVVASGRDACR